MRLDRRSANSRICGEDGTVSQVVTQAAAAVYNALSHLSGGRGSELLPVGEEAPVEGLGVRVVV